VSKPPVLKCTCPFDQPENGYIYTTHCGCDKCEYPWNAPIKPKKVSENMIHARELDINAVTTVSDLFELIDLPYRITNKATLSVVSASKDPACVPVRVLRLEWRGDDE
jgi:hypothetical protein